MRVFAVVKFYTNVHFLEEGYVFSVFLEFCEIFYYEHLWTAVSSSSYLNPFHTIRLFLHPQQMTGNSSFFDVIRWCRKK